MHLWRPCLVLCLFAAAANGAVIYKWTDADGVIHFSDQPVPGAEKIVTSSTTSNGVGGTAARGSSSVPSETQTGAPAAAPQFAVVSPAKDQVFFNDDIVPVRLALEPALKGDQTITWHMNGKQLEDQPPNSVSFSLQSLPRGAYTVAATLTDSATGVSKTTDSVTFYVRQPSELSLQHRTH